MPRVSSNIISQISSMKKAAPPRGLSGLLFSVPTGLYLGQAALRGVGKIARDGTAITNPWFFKNTHSGYGKRGIDSDRLGADGLVQSMHSKRRSQ